MNHEYQSNPNLPNEDKCIECGYPESKHGNNAVCDCCELTGNLQPYLLGNSQALLTRECMEREKALLETQIKINDAIRTSGVQQYGVPADAEDRVLQYHAIINPYDKLIGDARKLDDQLHLSSDLFTAKTVPIEELRKAVWSNPDIPNDKKFFEFVRICKQRINTLQGVIFSLDKEKIEAYSEQKAWHVAMNDYANKLRKEEREQLRIQDVTYDVKMPKPVTPRAIKTNTKKASKAELRTSVSALNAELVGTGKDGIAEFTVEMIMVSKNWTLDQTINYLRKTLKEGLSETKI